MADFFSRIFAIPSDDDSYSAEDTYSQGSSVPRRPTSKKKSTKHHRRRSTSDNSEEESSASISLDDDSKNRGRRRRNDAASYGSASEARKKKRSSSERPGYKPANSNGLTGRRRTARSLSKVAERERSLPPPDAAVDDEAQKKMKSWRSKFSKGTKKHSASADKSPPLPPRQSSKKLRDARKGSTTGQETPPHPVNVGDYITISQQYLEENADMSVLTLPRELNNKELEEEILMQVGQRGVLGNNAVQAFLDRRSTPAHGDDINEEIHLHKSTSAENGVYERVSSYATKLLDISYSRSLENGPSADVEEVSADGSKTEVNRDSLAVDNHLVGKHRWPCDPTAEGYEPAGIERGEGSVSVVGSNSVVTEQEIGSIGVPPPPSSSSVSAYEVADDPSGIRFPSPVKEFNENNHLPPKLDEKRRPFDEPSSTPGEDGDRPFRSNKSVSFCLPTTLSHPPAPPFLGPTIDYYYSMERQPTDSTPIWSNSLILPPIIELWSSVEGAAPGSFGSVWDHKMEMKLVGEDAPLMMSEDSTSLSDKKAEVVEKEVPKKPLGIPASPGEKSIEHFNSILDCGDEDMAPLDEKEGLKFTSSSLSIKTDPATSTETEPTSEDALYRHRSQWKSSQNMTYKPPMFNNVAAKEPSLRVGPSESSDDSVLQLRRFHGDDVPSSKKQHSQEATRPVILHGRVIRHANVSPNANNLSKSSYIARSPSTASCGSTSSYNAKTHAAIAIQAATRGMLERQRFMVMINSALVIQLAVRRFLCMQRYLVQLKLKRSYFPGNWKRKVLEN